MHTNSIGFVALAKKRITRKHWAEEGQRFLLESDNNPNFIFLTYDKSTLEIRNFLSIPKYFFVPAPPPSLPPPNTTGVRRIWGRCRAEGPRRGKRRWGLGCNIDVSNVPDLGKIFFVQNGIVRSKDEVLERWSKTEFVRSTGSVDDKGWLLDVLVCVERIKKQEFSLDDVYAFEGVLKAKHPANNNVRAKIRQQLQFLREKGVVRFLGRGQYRMKRM